MNRIRSDERRSLEEQLIKKIWGNPDFKRELSIDPSKVIKEKFNIDIPLQSKVFIHNEKVDEIHIVIPKY